MLRKTGLLLCGAALWLGGASAALAQNYSGGASSSSSALNQIALRNAQALLASSLQQSSSIGPAARIGLGAGTSLSGGKPFSGYSAPPTVSPYVNLFRTDINGQNAFNYSTLVRPQLQQQQINQQLQRQQSQESRQLQRIAAQPQLNPQGSKDLYPTGHQTVFLYYDHYYSGAGARRKQR